MRPNRPTELANLVARHPALANQLEELVAAYTAMENARAPYQDAQQSFRHVRSTLDGLPLDDPQRPQMLTDVRVAQEELETLTRDFVDARKTYQQLRETALNIRAGPRGV